MRPPADCTAGLCAVASRCYCADRNLEPGGCVPPGSNPIPQQRRCRRRSRRRCEAGRRPFCCTGPPCSFGPAPSQRLRGVFFQISCGKRFTVFQKTSILVLYYEVVLPSGKVVSVWTILPGNSILPRRRTQRSIRFSRPSIGHWRKRAITPSTRSWVIFSPRTPPTSPITTMPGP